MILRRTGWVRRQAPSDVNDAFTAKRAGRKRQKREIDAAAVRRWVTAYGRKVGDGDPADLADLLALDEQLHGIIAATVTHMREHQEFTWQAIADAAGTSRQAAQQRWGKPKTQAGPVSPDP